MDSLHLIHNSHILLVPTHLHACPVADKTQYLYNIVDSIRSSDGK